ncbi:unnamed protein product [Nippostrongylus brasiliensis]|uniref:COesterase domain-containing protein n=1 Tax=Nippostrongylus brasiliensis TaxID=27835 RepID=A0A158R0A3_NIPBR|nr:unnamed protein product [Nippostrongylus brasiliensis]
MVFVAAAPPFCGYTFRYAQTECGRRSGHHHCPLAGNGPAGLSMSAFLSGVLPFYNPDTPHPDQVMNQKLMQNIDLSLIDQDLEWCRSLDTIGESTRPLSVLYDSLVRPGADLGAQIPSRLLWQTDPTRHIPHLVLGETAIGGSWNNYDPEVSTCVLFALALPTATSPSLSPSHLYLSLSFENILSARQSERDLKGSICIRRHFANRPCYRR